MGGGGGEENVGGGGGEENVGGGGRRVNVTIEAWCVCVCVCRVCVCVYVCVCVICVASWSLKGLVFTCGCVRSASVAVMHSFSFKGYR